MIFHFILSFPFLGHHPIEQTKDLSVCWFNVIEQISKEQVVKMKVAKPVTASNVFYLITLPFCLGVM